MKNFLYAVGSVVVSVGLAFVLFGHTVEQKLGSYVPNQQNPTAVGFSVAYTTSTALTGAQFCYQNQLWSGTSALATDTLPAATTTFASCGANLGALLPGFLTNDSTNTVDVVAGSGDVFLCETQGVGTSTVVGGCTASQLSVLASSTVSFQSYYDTSSSTLKIVVGNNNH